MKQIVGIDNFGAYTFNAASKTITITGINTLTLNQLLLITNVTKNIVVYQFNSVTKGATISGNVITLTFDTTTHADTDKMQIIVDYAELSRGVQFASVRATASGNTSIVAANATKKIKVLSYTLVADDTVNVKWQSATTDLTGAMAFLGGGGVSTPVGSRRDGWLLETAVNQALNLNLSSAVGVSGHISYFLEE